MIKQKFALIATLLLLCINVQAQQYGFEWIKLYQPYYKIKIATTGIFTIDSATLASYGVNLVGVHPKRFQLFKNGIEERIYVSGQQDGILNQQDFIEFYATPNDGKFDSILYTTPAAQPHQFRSLFSDTAVYFLTILPDTTVVNAKRFQLQTDVNFGAYTSETYYANEVKIFPANEYLDGINLNAGGEKYNTSEYTDGEGWADSRLGIGQSRVYNLSTPNISSIGFAPQIECKVVGLSDYILNNPPNNHHVRISIAPTENLVYTTVTDFVFKGYISQKYSGALSQASIGISQTAIKLDIINDLAVASDFNSLSYIKLTYPRTYNWSNQLFTEALVLHTQGAVKSRLTLTNYGNGTFTNPRMYDFVTGKRIVGEFNLGTVNLLTDNTGKPHKICVFDTAQSNTITVLEKVTFTQINPNAGYQFIIVTHPSLNDAASQYASYRGQKYTVLKVFAQQLYDYYTYGNNNPLAIKRLANHLLKEATVKPKYLTLLGKGYQNNLLRTQKYVDANLVPAIGMPAADALFTAGLVGNGFENDIPTGRIPAATNSELNNYLQKLIYYETAPDSIQLWRKNILHITGGEGLGQQTAFKNQMDGFGNTIKGKSFGANIFAYNKSSTDGVQGSLREILTAKINNGVSMLSFLGHGSATVIDVEFGNINEINNSNKYSFFYFNGCNIGNPSDIDPTTQLGIYGKDFICFPNKGAIGWLAHSNLTLDGKLYGQMNAFYNQFSITNYGKPIGDIIKQASISLSGNDVFMKSHCIQLTLMGDPAVTIYSPSLPDYKVENNDLFIFPENANAKLDSIAVGVIVTNLAKATSDTLTVSVLRTLPNNTRKQIVSKFNRAVFYKDTLLIWMPVDDVVDVGNNIFEVKIDYQNAIIESSKINNTALFNVYLPGNGIRTLLPVKDEIVTADSVQLVTQNNDLFITNTSYLFEIDTTPLFNSSLKQVSGVITTGALAKWKVKLTAPDSTVYFWRARMNVPENQGGLWDTTSFVLIRNGNNGWMQKHTFQYGKAANLTGLVKTESGLSFTNIYHEVEVRQARWRHQGQGVFDPYFNTPGAFNCLPSNSGLIAVFFNGTSLEKVSVSGYPYNCSPDPTTRYYVFDTKTIAGQNEFVRMVDSMSVGSYLALYTYYDAGITSWGTNMRNALTKLGSVKLANATSFYTCGVMIGRKGELPGMAIEDTTITDQFNAATAADSNFVVVRRLLQGNGLEGSITSQNIGPSSTWNNIQSQFNSIENAGTDITMLSVYAVNKQGVDSLVIHKSNNLSPSLAFLDAAKYPYIKLKVDFFDSVYRTPNQFGKWLVNYTTPPEGAFNPQIAYKFHQSPIEQGDSLWVEIAFENVSNKAFDSLPIVFTITNNDRIVKYKSSFTETALAPYAFKIIKHKMPTVALQGENILSYSVNGTGQFAEVSLNNNFINKGFDVTVDKENPFLDVTFDGYRIMSGDFVSPTPVIRLLSKDENKFRIQNDTNVFALFLKKPNGNNSFEKINLSSTEIAFSSGTATNNTAIVDYKPSTLPDGDYTLRVQSTDATGNLAGNNNYEVEFKVLNESTITNFYPYPNPGTTNIRFVFTLTGSKVPDQLLIRIMTITGKVVKEITTEEFGRIKIGNNVSEYGWDGTDNFGDRLANGVYLYQVLTRINGDSIEKRKTQADRFVVHNTGKIYLLK